MCELYNKGEHKKCFLDVKLSVKEASDEISFKILGTRKIVVLRHVLISPMCGFMFLIK